MTKKNSETKLYAAAVKNAILRTFDDVTTFTVDAILRIITQQQPAAYAQRQNNIFQECTEGSNAQRNKERRMKKYAPG